MHEKNIAHTQRRRKWLPLAIIPVSLAVLFFLLTLCDYSRITKEAEETLFFVQERLGQYYGNLENERAQHLFELSDKTVAFCQLLSESSLPSEDLAQQFVQEQRLDGILVTDGDLECIFQTEKDAYSQWKDVLAGSVIAEILEHPEKKYMSSHQIGTTNYDFAVSARSDTPGLILAYRISSSDTSGAGLSLSALFDGYTLENNGGVIIVQDDRIVGTNMEDLLGRSLEDAGLSTRKEQTVRGQKLVSWQLGHEKWYGCRREDKYGTLYVMFPRLTAFRFRTLMMVCGVVLELFVWLLLQAYRSRLTKASMVKLQEQYARELDYQRQLKEQAEQVQRANIAKTDFLRRMSHDIRTPINGIMGMVSICRHHIGDPEKQEECLSKIMSASGFLLDLVNDVLDMNKLESGQIKLEKKPFVLSEVVDDVNELIRAQALERGLSFTTEEEIPACDDHLLGSSLHLKQILQNIASNAVKYNREKGRIRLICREKQSDGDHAVFEFICADTGIGMSREFQERLYEPFEQEKASARTEYSGTGLGLSITKSMVEQMGGSIRFTSEQGVGTTFYITLTFEIDHNVPETAPAKEMHHSVEGCRVLLTEDNELNIEIARFLLESSGIEVEEARNGEEALTQFCNSAPGYYDLILMDIMMPVMNGLEAVRRLRALDRPDAKTIPIVAMSANAFAEDREQSLKAGMNDHIPKPVDAKVLIATIERYYSGGNHHETDNETEPA